MHVLVVAPYLPFEGILHAGGEYLLRHLQALSRSARVTLVVPGSPEALETVGRAPDWLELVLCPLELEARSTGLRLHDAAYRRLMAAPPMPTAESLRALRAGGLVQRARDADVVELHWPEYARLASELRAAGVRTPVCVVEHDVDVRGAVTRMRTRLSGYRVLLGVATSPLSRRRELRGLRDADLVCVFKPSDGELLRAKGVRTAVRVIDPWLEVPGPTGPARRPGEVLFTGAMWRPENSTAAAWLLAQVWPTVRERVPAATLTLAGAGADEALQRAAAAAGGVEVTGEVPSLLPCYQRASVFVAPLLSGGGLKFKVPQAMLCGLPVLGTTVAMEGIADVAPDGVLWAVSDDPGVLAERLVDALRDPEAASAVGAAGATWAAERFSFERSLEGLLSDYRRLATGSA